MPVSKTPAVESIMGNFEVFANTLNGKQRAEFVRSFRMLSNEQQNATRKLNPIDADHFYVYSLAIRAGFKKVDVRDNPLDIQNPDTIHLPERMVRFIGDEFRASKTPMTVTGRYVASFSMQHQQNRPQEEPVHDVAVAAL